MLRKQFPKTIHGPREHWRWRRPVRSNRPQPLSHRQRRIPEKRNPRLYCSENHKSVLTCSQHLFLWSKYCLVKVKVKVILQQAWTGQRGSRSVKAPDFLDVRRYKGGRSSAVLTGSLYARRNPWYSFCRGWVDPRAHVSVGATEKIRSDTTGNRSRDRPTSSAVP